MDPAPGFQSARDLHEGTGLIRIFRNSLEGLRNMEKDYLPPRHVGQTKEFSQGSLPGREFGDFLFVDGHVDLPWFIMNQTPLSSLSAVHTGPFTLDKARQAGIGFFCSALYCEDRFNGTDSFRHFQEILSFTLDRFDRIPILKGKRGPDTLEADPRNPGTFFLLENADALAENLSYIEHLKETGIQIVGLTHVGKNRLADGNNVAHSDGLTKAGRAVIAALVKNDLPIDVAHLHAKCFWQVMHAMESPVLSSHTGIREVCNIPRNLDLSQVKEIFERGGMIGISFNPEMLSKKEKASVEDVFAHLDTVVQKFGPERVGIGSDFCGFDLVTDGLEDITGLPNLTESMRAHGYGSADVAGIMGSNWLRFYGTVF